MSDPLLSIGQLARRSGVDVRTIRFWSDEGLLPPSRRSGAGHRRYDAAAVARLDLVRTLRELGLGHEQVRAVLDRRRGVAEVAAAHIDAIDSRIRALRVQRAVCTLLARGAPDDRTVTLMNDLARLSATERQAVLDDFVDATFAGTDPDAPGAGIGAAMRSLPAELPDEPTVEQVQAWVELAELTADPAFRARCREMAVAGATRDASTAVFDPAAVTEHAGAALAAGTDPASPAAGEVLERILGPGLDATARREVADTVETFGDRRVERYWQLLGTLNGWAPFPSSVPAFEWFAAALRAR